MIRGLYYLLNVSVVATFLSGCGGAQPPVGAPGNSWIGTHHKGDLIYALEATRESGGEIFAYPSGKLVGYFGFPQSHFFSYGICSDSKGNVFATVGGVSYNFIDEFAHGGTSPIATLIGGYFWPLGCSADPSTGNLAVVGGYGGYIGIYRHARGSPHLYYDSSFNAQACSYDSRGNLFVVGSPLRGGYFALAELPKDKNKFTNISLNKKLGNPSSIQWDGTNLAIEAQTLVKGQPGRFVVYRVQVSGSRGKILGTTQFKDWRRPGRSTILRGAFVAVYGAHAKSIGYWQYPSGGRAYRVSKDVAISRLGNLTISVGPR